MFVLRSFVAVLSVVLIVFNANILAQDRPIELGVDGSLEIFFIDNNRYNLTSFQLPTKRLRVGFFISESFSIEPSFSLSVLSGGGSSAIALVLELAGHYHLTKERSRPRAYFGPKVVFLSVDVGSTSNSQFGIEADFGVKLPMSNRLATRLEFGVSRFFEGNFSFAFTTIFARFGLSFFTK